MTNWNHEFDKIIRPTLQTSHHARIPSQPGHTPALNAPEWYCNNGDDGYPVYPRYVAPSSANEPPRLMGVSPIIVAVTFLGVGMAAFTALYWGMWWVIDNCPILR